MPNGRFPVFADLVTALGCGLHNTGYDFNDAVAPHGVALFAGLVRRHLRTGA